MWTLCADGRICTYRENAGATSGDRQGRRFLFPTLFESCINDLVEVINTVSVGQVLHEWGVSAGGFAWVQPLQLEVVPQELAGCLPDHANLQFETDTTRA